MLCSYEAVFFDAGETLFRVYPSVGHHYQRVAMRFGCTATVEALDAAFREVWVAHDGAAHARQKSDPAFERAWWRSVVFDVFERTGGVEDCDALFGELYALFGGPDVWQLYPGVVEVLTHLKEQDKKIGIISNWNQTLPNLCDALGLSEYLDFVIASGALGAAKPDPRIFQAGLDRAGVEPGNAVHIGDSIHDDVRGASRVGLDAILIDRKPETRGDEHLANIPALTVVRDLMELIGS